MLVRKGVYPYEHMDDQENFYEITLPEKKKNYGNLNIEEITDVDYSMEKEFVKILKLKI